MEFNIRFIMFFVRLYTMAKKEKKEVRAILNDEYIGYFESLKDTIGVATDPETLRAIIKQLYFKFLYDGRIRTNMKEKKLD